MKDLLVPIDNAGRIVLPKNIREELAIKPGDNFKITVSGIAVTLTPDKAKTGFVRKGKALIFMSPGDEMLTNETVNSILQEERERHILHTERKPRLK